MAHNWQEWRADEEYVMTAPRGAMLNAHILTSLPDGREPVPSLILAVIRWLLRWRGFVKCRPQRVLKWLCFSARSESQSPGLEHPLWSWHSASQIEQKPVESGSRLLIQSALLKC